MRNIRKPKVSNKYNLTIDKIKKLKVNESKRNLICESLFWRNNVISAWCICESFGHPEISIEYWMGIYDVDAKAYKGKFKFYFTSYGGMCSYTFKKFFDYAEIENELDLCVQEAFLEKINYLIDNQILIFSDGGKKL